MTYEEYIQWLKKSIEELTGVPKAFLRKRKEEQK